MFKCSNPSCRLYGGTGYRLTVKDVTTDIGGKLHCKACGAFAQVEKKKDDSGARVLAGGAGGALLGFALGGPGGVVVGALLGLLAGSSAAERDKES